MNERYRFGPFTLDVATRKLCRDDEELPLPSRAFDTLVHLVRQHGRLVDKNQLIKEVWEGISVSDDSLVHCVLVLRRALGDDAERPRYIATVPRRGYRFVAEVSTSSEAPQPQPHQDDQGDRVRRRRFLTATVGLTACAIAVFATRTLMNDRPSSPDDGLSSVRLAQLPPDGTSFASGGVLSPDGRQLAFIAREQSSGVSRVWVRSLDSPTVAPVAGTDGATKPFWSPDSTTIGFFAGDKLKAIRLADKAVRTLAPVMAAATGGSWGADNQIAFGDSDKGLNLVPASGGSISTLTTVDSSLDAAHAWPSFLPDGHHFLFTILSWNAERAGIWIGSVDRPDDLHRIATPMSPAVYVSPGYLLYLQNNNLVAAPFDAAQLRLDDGAVVLARNVPIPRLTDGDMFSVSSALLSVRTGVKTEHLVWFARDGRQLDAVNAPTVLFNPALSTDGRFLLATGAPTRDPGLWLVNLAENTSTRLGGDAIGPIWSPDGRQVAFTARGGIEIRVRGTTGSDTETLLLRDEHRKVLQDWSPDGQFLVYTALGADGNIHLWRLPRSGSEQPTRLLATPANERYARLSPDGRWVAYTSDESGRSEVYIQQFPTLGSKRAVTVSGGAMPFWRQDGHELFYLSPDRTLRSVSITSGSALSIGRDEVLFRAPLVGDASGARNHYVPAVDGHSFLFNVTEDSTERSAIAVVVNWQAQLRAARTAALVHDPHQMLVSHPEP